VPPVVRAFESTLPTNAHFEGEDSSEVQKSAKILIINILLVNHLDPKIWQEFPPKSLILKDQLLKNDGGPSTYLPAKKSAKTATLIH
jgi:hypothetical protein